MENKTCICGREHKADTKNIVIEKNAINNIHTIVKDGGYQHILLVSDCHTYKLVGLKVKSLLGDIPYSEFMYEDTFLVPDETAVGQLLTATTTQTDLILTLGSGTLNDLSRYISFRLGIPYIIFATAPSMDGYASNVSPLIITGLKTTYEAVVPHSIIGDTDILQTAPMLMIGAGLSDIFGKYNCLCDWKLSHLVNDEYYCDYVADLTGRSIEKCISAMDGLSEKHDTTINSIMEGLVLSGTAMSYVGNSRPASGSEHHLSHYWEMMFLFTGKQAILHGTKVGIATLVMIRLHQLLLAEEIDWEGASAHARTYSFEHYQANIETIYGRAAQEIIREENISQRNNTENTLKRLAIYRSNWDTIKTTIKECIPEYAYIKDLLIKAESPVSPREIGIDRQMFTDSIVYAKELRQRFTVLQIVGDLGLLPTYAEKLASFFYDV